MGLHTYTSYVSVSYSNSEHPQQKIVKQFCILRENKWECTFYKTSTTHFVDSNDPFGNHLMVGYPVTSYLVHKFFWSSQSTYSNTRKCQNHILFSKVPTKSTTVTPSFSFFFSNITKYKKFMRRNNPKEPYDIYINSKLNKSITQQNKIKIGIKMFYVNLINSHAKRFLWHNI